MGDGGVSRVRFGCDQREYIADAAVTDREATSPRAIWLAGRSETPRQRRGVGDNVPGAVLLEDVTGQQPVEELLSLLAQRLPVNSPSGSMNVTSCV
jgi:hypothetical protein